MKPSIPTRFVSWMLRTTGTYRKLYSGGELFQENLAKNRAAPFVEPSAKTRDKLAISKREVDGRPIWTFAPKDKSASAYVLYWHGGGYVYPAAEAHFGFLAHMAETYGWHITAPLYPLAPEKDAAHVTSWALDLYQDYVAERSGTPFMMGGDSAGGGLAAVIAMAAQEGKLATPAALLLICPWLNADPSHPIQPNIEKRDAILTLNGIREAGLLYANGLAITDPLVSPIYGNWEGLPPILSFGGGDDILVTDARALKEKLPSITYVEREGMIHDWPIFIFKESRQAQKQMADFAAEFAAP